MYSFLILFSAGGIGYCLIEILWRGYTHWSMFILGGLCLFLLIKLFGAIGSYPLVVKTILGGGLITLLEFITGCIVNIFLRWNVWNYSDTPWNILGQICLPYTFLWMLLCIPIILLCPFVEKYIG